MPVSVNDLHSIAQLAYLEINSSEITALAEEVSSIIDFVQQLKKHDTRDVAPLFHPMDLHQPLRTDEVSEESCLKELAEIAPHFEKQLYLVPKVIEAEK